jgi:organic hydroperoxide reductase OsmC/OhrA
MPNRQHRYSVTLRWTGNLGRGTADYRAYARTHELRAPGKPVLAGSADPGFRGDADRWNPEELLVASLSACHQLWYLHLAAEAGLVVTA